MIKALIFAAILGSGGLAQNFFGSPSAFNIVNPGTVITGADPVLDTTGRTEVACGPMDKDTLVLVYVGQSLLVNESPTPHTFVNSGVDQLNIWDGKCYVAKDPLLGINVSGGPVTAQRGTYMSRMADLLIGSGKAKRVVIVPMAVGNTRADQWASDTAAPFLKKNINAVALRIAAAGLACSAIMWGQGESDTAAGTTQAAHTAALTSVFAEFNRAMPCPILVSQQSYYYGATNAGVLAAQAAAVNGTTVFAGPNFDSIPSTQRYDNTHLNDTGAATGATLGAAALVTALGL